MKRQLCEVYARVVGYIRPVKQWNEGKQSEYSDRKEFKVDKSGTVGPGSDGDKQV